jgi:hypothetical protein
MTLEHTRYHIVSNSLNTPCPLRLDLVLGRAGRRTGRRSVRRRVLRHLALVLGRRRVLLLERVRRAGGLYSTQSAQFLVRAHARRTGAMYAGAQPPEYAVGGSAGPPATC